MIHVQEDRHNLKKKMFCYIKKYTTKSTIIKIYIYMYGFVSMIMLLKVLSIYIIFVRFTIIYNSNTCHICDEAIDYIDT